MSNTASNQNLSAVRAIGAGIRHTEESVPSIVASLPDGFDYKKAGAVTGAIHAWAVGCQCPSGRGKVCQCGNRPSIKVGGKSTDYGRGVDTLTSAVKSALAAPAVKPALRLAVNLSGTEVTGGTVVVASDHPMFESLMALFAPAEESAPALSLAI